jgi:hypothetical protein
VLNRKFEYQGYWCLPGTEENKVPGILTFDPDDGAILKPAGFARGLCVTVPLNRRLSWGSHLTGSSSP